MQRTCRETSFTTPARISIPALPRHPALFRKLWDDSFPSKDRLATPSPASEPKPQTLRDRDLSRLENEEFDVLVIGGGVTGAAAALDACSRNLKVALVERGDFASGTSSRSTKLIHGGVRYLEQAVKTLDLSMLSMVREALRERVHMLESAPYMNRELPIVVPLYSYWEVSQHRRRFR